MQETSTHRDPAEGKQVVYVTAAGRDSEWGEDFDLRALWSVVVLHWKLILFCTLLFAGAGVAYALLATEKFTAQVVLIPAKSNNTRGLLSQFGGLASLAGITLGSDDHTEPLAMLRSKSLTREFIRERNLVEVLLESRYPRFKGEKRLSQAVDYFDRRVKSVSEDRKTGLVTVTIEWKDPVVAAEWANALVERLNERMRQRALDESTKNVAYLRGELASNNVVALQESISKLLEVELQTIMLARGNIEYSYRVVDRATPPHRRSWPKRTLTVGLSAALGAFLAVLILSLRQER
jgi:uncharacterized protein involved in exopolysaccharide biosynthesis